MTHLIVAGAITVACGTAYAFLLALVWATFTDRRN